MRSRRVRFVAAMTALASMLVVQVSMALAACDVAPVTQSMQAHAAPCHEPQHSDNLCAAHCRNNDQTLDKPQVKVAAPAATVASTPAARIPQLVSSVPAWRAPLSAGPPRRILFQSFLI